jgi:hypothetical protein
MASRDDSARLTLSAVSAGLNLIVGALLLAGPLNDIGPFSDVLTRAAGAVLAVVGAALLLFVLLSLRAVRTRSS